MPSPLLPADDLYARLELTPDASPEAVELAWRALLKRHHPDVAGEHAEALERAKRINVAHDWLADPALRDRYDRERLGRIARRVAARGGPRAGRPRPAGDRGAATATAPRRPRTNLDRGDPAVRLARFLDRAAALTGDEYDRLAAADPPPIAFLATVRRFLPPAAVAAFAEAEAATAARVPPARWADAAVRGALVGVVAELVAGAFLDEHLDEPFRGRARERLLRGWEASVDQPRLGPNAGAVVALRDRVARLSSDEAASFVRASRGIAADERPWPVDVDPAEDEALRISAAIAARDVAAAVPGDILAPAAMARLRRLLEQVGHVAALRHAFPSATYLELLRPWTTATGRTAAGTEAAEPGRARVRRSG